MARSKEEQQAMIAAVIKQENEIKEHRTPVDGENTEIKLDTIIVAEHEHENKNSLKVLNAQQRERGETDSKAVISIKADNGGFKEVKQTEGIEKD